MKGCVVQSGRPARCIIHRGRDLAPFLPAHGLVNARDPSSRSLFLEIGRNKTNAQDEPPPAFQPGAELSGRRQQGDVTNASIALARSNKVAHRSSLSRSGSPRR